MPNICDEIMEFLKEHHITKIRMDYDWEYLEIDEIEYEQGYEDEE